MNNLLFSELFNSSSFKMFLKYLRMDFSFCVNNKIKIRTVKRHHGITFPHNNYQKHFVLAVVLLTGRGC